MAGVPASAARWTSSPYSVAAADRLARELGLSLTVAAILVRRGHADVAQARAFLAADERHDPGRFEGIGAACDLILGHVRRGSRIVIHGDYDVDGVCSTAILAGLLRSLGADPAWHLPARMEDGYGLSATTVDALAARGTGLLITADCAITAAAEVERAKATGMDVVVTDHHRPADRLPDCPVVHPGVCGYPFDGLCAAGVVHKLSEALLSTAGADPAAAEEQLDLVALATVCDVVPLLGENRRLVREGLRALARTRRAGLRALMRSASVDPGAVDEHALGFRLGPRLNAAGRLRRADAALELLLTEDDRRAAEVADELERLNRERRDTETRILFAAEAARADQAEAPAYVLAGEGWHPGVIGIVASRMAQRHHRPCVMVALDADEGRGSGRSIPGFDLHAALSACSGHLRRFGGHRAAAGLELDRAALEPFTAAFTRHAAATLSAEDLRPVEAIDAVVPGTELGLPLAEELRRLAPFGEGNREPTLLVPAVRLAGVAPMGDDGQHARFALVSGGARARAVAFRTPQRSLACDEPQDAAVQLEAREWMGAVEPRLVLRALCPTEGGRCRVIGEPEDFWAELELELAHGDAWAGGAAQSADGARARELRDRRGEGLAGLAGGLLSSGEPVLVVVADVARRLSTLERLVAGLAPSESQLALCSWPHLARDPSIARSYPQLLAFDPPPLPWGLELLAAAPAADGGFVHLGWGAPEATFALALARAELELRGPLGDLYRGLRSAGTAEGPVLRVLLEGDGRYPRTPATCARMLQVLGELQLAVQRREGGGGLSCRAVARERTTLEESAAYRAALDRLEECRRFLRGEGASEATPSDQRAAV